jgi:hypothetical protein
MRLLPPSSERWVSHERGNFLVNWPDYTTQRARRESLIFRNFLFVTSVSTPALALPSLLFSGLKRLELEAEIYFRKIFHSALPHHDMVFTNSNSCNFIRSGSLQDEAGLQSPLRRPVGCLLWQQSRFHKYYLWEKILDIIIIIIIGDTAHYELWPSEWRYHSTNS